MYCVHLYNIFKYFDIYIYTHCISIYIYIYIYITIYIYIYICMYIYIYIYVYIEIYVLLKYHISPRQELVIRKGNFQTWSKQLGSLANANKMLTQAEECPPQTSSNKIKRVDFTTYTWVSRNRGFHYIETLMVRYIWLDSMVELICLFHAKNGTVKAPSVWKRVLRAILCVTPCCL